MTPQRMCDLPKGATFQHPLTGHEYKVTTPACDHPNGWVEVWNLTMGDGEVLRMLNTPGAAEDGTHPRQGFFTRGQIERDVEVLP